MAPIGLSEHYRTAPKSRNDLTVCFSTMSGKLTNSVPGCVRVSDSSTTAGALREPARQAAGQINARDVLFR